MRGFVILFSETNIVIMEVFSSHLFLGVLISKRVFTKLRVGSRWVMLIELVLVLMSSFGRMFGLMIFLLVFVSLRFLRVVVILWATVSEIYSENGWCIDIRRALINEELAQCNELYELLDEVNLGNGTDIMS
ncbi:hypothetical protein GUJ93_ZPchr0013g35990 [Zizania palustris]|uniref:Transmembrane protein n=1 Tax=Zizania palustris TaxID=103762 RepID=A0A8J6BUQ4_ZIZPA|nr:hypothetical protein GUJ93_ZPchr0013g35990 [Zizania palustris]